jgi:hypothetical protein
MLRHPSARAAPVVYPTEGGEGQHLLVGGEGAVQFYRFYSHTLETGGVPVFMPPVPVSPHVKSRLLKFSMGFSRGTERAPCGSTFYSLETLSSAGG